MSSRESILDLQLKLLRLSGFFKQQNVIDKFLVFITFIFIIIVDVSILMSYFSMEGNTENFVVLSEGAGSYAQMTTKMWILIKHHEEMNQLLVVMKNKFWTYDHFGTEFGDKLRIYPNTLNALIKMLYVITVTTVLMIFLKPFLYHKLCYECWRPDDGDMWFWIATTLQIETIAYCCFVVSGFDSLFAILYIELTVQFKLLNHAFTRMEKASDIRSCVEHQCFLFGFVNKLERIYSIFFLMEYFGTMIVVCMQFLIIMDSNLDIALRMKGAFYVICLLLDLSFICFPVSLLQDEVCRSTVSIYTLLNTLQQ